MDNVKLRKSSVFAYGFGEAGYQMACIIQSSFLLYFLVNFGGVSASIVGMIMLVARIWDAVNDPMMGALVDNTNTKYGKARPYVLGGAIPAAISLSLLFLVPQGLSQNMRIIWVAITYISFGSFLTMVSIPYSTLIVRLSDDSAERLALSRSRSLIGTVGLLLPPILITLFATGKPNEGYRMGIIIAGLSVMYIIFNFIVFLGTKEISKESDSDKVNVILAMKCLIRNKYWRRISLSYLTYGIMYGISNGVMVFYLTCRYNQPKFLMTLMAFVMVAMLIASAISKPIAEKIGKRNFILIGLTIAVLGCVLRLLLGDSTILIYTIGFTITQFGATFYHVSLRPLVGDAIDYGEQITGTRVESIAFSGLTFTNKAGIGLASMILGFMLDSAGYLENVINQTPKVINTMFIASNIIPLVAMSLMLIIIMGIRVEKDLKKIDLAHR